MLRNGRGISLGTLFGREIARLILGDKTEADLPLPLSDLSAISLRWGRETYFEIGAQLAHLTTARSAV